MTATQTTRPPDLETYHRTELAACTAAWKAETDVDRARELNTQRIVHAVALWEMAWAEWLRVTGGETR